MRPASSHALRVASGLLATLNSFSMSSSPMLIPRCVNSASSARHSSASSRACASRSSLNCSPVMPRLDQELVERGALLLQAVEEVAQDVLARVIEIGVGDVALDAARKLSHAAALLEARQLLGLGAGDLVLELLDELIEGVEADLLGEFVVKFRASPSRGLP